MESYLTDKEVKELLAIYELCGKIDENYQERALRTLEEANRLLDAILETTDPVWIKARESFREVRAYRERTR